jgi:translation initiation factor 3 subunit K
MGYPFDYAPDRPEHIDQILNGLDRYNPETTQVFQDYVMQQCENQTYDCYANLALLKLYVQSFLLATDQKETFYMMNNNTTKRFLLSEDPIDPLKFSNISSI